MVVMSSFVNHVTSAYSSCVAKCRRAVAAKASKPTLPSSYTLPEVWAGTLSNGASARTRLVLPTVMRLTTKGFQFQTRQFTSRKASASPSAALLGISAETVGVLT